MVLVWDASEWVISSTALAFGSVWCSYFQVLVQLTSKKSVLVGLAEVAPSLSLAELEE